MPNYKIGIDLTADDKASASLGKVSGAADGLDDALTRGKGGISGLVGGLGEMLNPATLATGAVLAVGAALVATGAHAMDLSNQVADSTALMQTQLALTDEEAAGFQDTMRAIYADNFGTSFEDIAASLTTVEQGFARIGGIAPEELQKVTEDALAMRDAFGTDVQETIGATATLMENFGLTSTQAMDFLVAAQQKGLDSSGDLLDTIGEYSVQFSEGGATAGQFFSILEQGNAGGVLGTDKAADAFKEFGIRIKDDSATTKTALAAIGVDYETLRKGFADGSVTTVSAMQTVIDHINAIEDPVERAKAGVALFGTQWEDSGEKAILSMGELKDAIGETEGATASLGDQYDTTAGQIAAAHRQWDNSLVDVGDSLNQLTTFVLPGLAFAMNTVIVPAIKVFSDWLGELVAGVKAVTDFFGWIVPDMSPAEPAPTVPVTPPAQAQAGASSAGGPQIIQQFYIDRGDPDVVQSAAELGIVNAQRVRGG